jgi:hypothetical protein
MHIAIDPNPARADGKGIIALGYGAVAFEVGGVGSSSFFKATMLASATLAGIAPLALAASSWRMFSSIFARLLSVMGAAFQGQK